MIGSFGGHVTSGELVTVEKSKGRILSIPSIPVGHPINRTEELL